MDVVTLQTAKADAAKRYAAVNAHRMVAAGGIAVAGNCHATALDSPTMSGAGTSRIPFVIGTDCSDLRLLLTNWFSSSTNPYADADGTTTYTVTASIEVGGTYQARGTMYRVTLGGRTQGTIDPGGAVLTDPLGLEFAQGDVGWVNIWISATTWYSNKRTSNVLDSGGWTATTDLTAPGSAIVPGAASTRIYGPSAIIGTPKSTTAKALLISGHSIAHGYHSDNAGTAFPSFSVTQPLRATGGWAAVATRGVVGCTNAALDSQRGSQFIAGANHYRRLALARFHTHVLSLDQTNDIGNAFTLSQLQASMLAEAALYTRRGLKFLAATELPRTGSTDAWITTGNQTVQSSEAVRTAYNDWVRAGCPVNASTGVAVAVGTSGALLAGQPGHPVTSFVELADQVESARNSGLWKPALRIITDAAITSGSQTLTSATANFTAADIGQQTAIPGAGAAGAVLLGAISAVASSTSCTVANPAGATVSGATAGIGVMTPDGIHPSSRAHTLAAAGFNVNQLT